MPTSTSSAASTARASSTPPIETSTPWEPRFIDVATSPQSSFYEQLRVDYHLALTHYDHVIGVQDVQG